MPQAKFTAKARQDLLKISDYSRTHWGKERALRYVAGVEGACAMLASRPLLGRVATPALPRQRRMEHESHVIFYRLLDLRAPHRGVLILRILHYRMHAALHLPF